MLATLLQDEIATAIELHELLLREYTALKERNVSELEQTAVAKRACVDRLQKLSEQRISHLNQQGVSADAVQYPDQLGLEKLWAKLQEAILRAKRQNEINGTVIFASCNHVERALTILHGRDPQAYLYRQDAQMTLSSGSRTLAKV